MNILKKEPQRQHNSVVAVASEIVLTEETVAPEIFNRGNNSLLDSMVVLEVGRSDEQ